MVCAFEALSMDGISLDFKNYSSDDFKPLKKKQKRDFGTEYKKTVSILKQCDIKKRNNHVYRPLDFIMANIKKQKSRFGTVVLARDMTEEEVRKTICESFPILKNNRFSFAAADITGALDYHEESSWSGTEVKRRVPGGSALYVVMENDEDINESYSYNGVYKIKNVSTPNKTENTYAQAISDINSQHGGEKIHSVSSNSILSNDIEIVFSDTSSGRQKAISNPTCSLPCSILYSSNGGKSTVMSTDTPSNAKEYYGFEQNKDTKCNGMSIMFKNTENSTESFAREHREICGERAPVMKDKKLCSVSHSSLWNFSSQSCPFTYQISTNAQKLPGISIESNSPCYSLSTTTALLSRSLLSSGKVSVKTEEEIPAYFNTSSITKANSVKSEQTKVVEMSNDAYKLNNAHVSSNSTQPRSTSVESAFRTPNNGVKNTDIFMSFDNLQPRNNLTETRMTTKPETSIKTTKTAAVRPCCTDAVRKIAILSDAQRQDQGPLISSSETFKTVNLLEEKAHWSSILNSSRKRFERALDDLLEVVGESSKKQSNTCTGGYGIVDEIIPWEGSCLGGQDFVVILKEVLPTCFKEDEVVVRFGQDPDVVEVLWKGDKTLKGKTKPARKSGSVRVTLETTGGAILGHTQFSYKDQMIETLKHIIYSQELSPLFLALLEQNIQGCRHSNLDRDRDGEAHRKSLCGPVRSTAQSLVRLMVYIAAQCGANDFIHTVFSNRTCEMAFSKYSFRSMRPEEVAFKMGHEKLAQYLEKQFRRLSSAKIKKDTDSDGGRSTLTSATVQATNKELDNRVPASLMLLSDVASRLNVADGGKHKMEPKISNVNNSHCPNNTLYSKVVNDRTYGIRISSSTRCRETNKEKPDCSSGDSILESFKPCSENSHESGGSIYTSQAKNSVLDGVICSSENKKSLKSTYPTKSSFRQTEFVQKVILLKDISSLTSLSEHSRPVSFEHTSSKNILLKVHMSEKEMKAIVACCFHLPDYDRILLATIDSCDKLCILKEEHLSGKDIFRITKGGRSALYVLQERVKAVQVENPHCSGDITVEFTKRVMILKDKIQFLPSAMELASRRRFHELYQSVNFSKKMEECEVLSQLRNVFKILGTVSFHLAVADRNGVLDSRSGKEWNGDNISKWAKNSCVLYLIPEEALKEDPYCALYEIHTGCDTRDPTAPVSTGSEKIGNLNERNLLETEADVVNGITIHNPMHPYSAEKNKINERNTVTPQMKVKQLVFKKELITDDSVGIT